MRKIFYQLMILMAVATGLASCENHDDLWKAIDNVNERVDNLQALTDRLNNDIAALNTIVNALRNNLTITSVTPTATGYEIEFSDGSKAVINHGRDGAPGEVSMPEISVALDSDGNYYWTIGGEWLIVDGQKVRANGIDGKDGADGKDGKDGNSGAAGSDGVSAYAPQVRINPDTKEWEISTDNGATWESTGVSAVGSSGQAGDSLFAEVDTSDPDCVTFVMADGTRFVVPRYDSSSPVFSIEGAGSLQIIHNGETRGFAVTEANVADFTISKPDGWKVTYADGNLSVTAPDENNTYAEQSGTIAVMAVSPSNKSMIAKLDVCTFELRILTFEDEDAKFSPFTLRRGSGYTITTWSDLIDSKEMGGDLLYDGYSGTYPYYWYDRNNTELKHTFPSGWGSYVFWSGGHAVSNYASNDIEATGSANNQLTIPGTKGSAGHNGSANFCVHFGYIDDSGFTMVSELPSLEFGDGKARVIDHMWVCPTNYALNCYTNGNGLTSKLGPADHVEVIATGYDASGKKGKEVQLTIAKGADFIIATWTKFDLSSLGKVSKVEFNILGSSDNGYGFSQPAYFAYDDVAVRF